VVGLQLRLVITIFGRNEFLCMSVSTVLILVDLGETLSCIAWLKVEDGIQLKQSWHSHEPGHACGHSHDQHEEETHARGHSHDQHEEETWVSHCLLWKHTPQRWLWNRIWIGGEHTARTLFSCSHFWVSISNRHLEHSYNLGASRRWPLCAGCGQSSLRYGSGSWCDGWGTYHSRKGY